MTMLAGVADAVIGAGTRRDAHEAGIADPAGKPVAVMRIGSGNAGFAHLLAALAEVAPGPRVAACVEGGRSSGTGLARTLTAAGVPVAGCEQPGRSQRRGEGKSGPAGARLAVPAALRPGAGRRPSPR